MDKKNSELVRRSINTASSNESVPVENLENITLIWLDQSIDETIDDCKKTLSLLHQMNHFFLTYIDSESCINYINTVDKEIIFLIVSGTLSKDVLPKISTLQQVGSIFIFCSNHSAYEYLKRDYPSNVVEIFTEQKLLIESIHQRLHLLSKQITAFSLFHQKQKSSRDLTKEAASFLWFQLLFSVLQEFPQSDDAKNQMLDKCTDYYNGNQTELNKIECFRNDYKSTDAIAWYTDESFVYRLLNKALRTEDIDGLYLFRFYIIDLCTQLKFESQNNVGTMIVYRGQAIFDQELDRLKRSVGSLISTNGFLSTTQSKDVALDFLKFSKRDELQSVLFEITANSTNKLSVFADIEMFSHHEGEQEVLFSVGTVFKIESVQFIDEMNYWIVKMTITDEGMANVQDYIDAIKNEYQDMNISIIFGRLLIEMDELTKAKTYFLLLLQSTKINSLEQADILDQLGRISYLRSEHETALHYYDSAYEIRKINLCFNHPKIARSLDNIGCIYHWTSDYENAVNYLKRALDIYYENYGNTNHINIANNLHHLGMAYRNRGYFQVALDYIINSLEMQRKLLPNEHARIADCLWSIGIVYARQKEYDIALQYYFDALKIFEKVFPVGHTETSRLFSQIVDAYKNKDDYDIALNMCQQKLNELSEVLGDTHPSIGNLLLQIGDIFRKYSDNDEALSYYEKALAIFQRCNPPEQYDITHTLNRIALLQEGNGNFQLALDNYMRELEIKQKLYLTGQPRTGCTLRNIGRMHLKLENYVTAMKYLEDALNIFKSKYPNDHDEVKSTLDLMIV